MKDLSLSDVLRYLFPGLVAYFYLYIVDHCFTMSLVKNLEVLGIIAFLFSGGLFYLIYRALIYSQIMRIQDKFRRHSNNFRTYIKTHYNVSSSYEAHQLWIQIKQEFFKDKYSSSEIATASGIHLLYLAGLIGLLFVIFSVVKQEYVISGILFLITLLLLYAGFMLDKSYEDIGYRYLCSLCEEQSDKLDKFVTTILNCINKNER